MCFDFISCVLGKVIRGNQMTGQDTGETLFNRTPLNTQQENRIPATKPGVFATISMFSGIVSILLPVLLMLMTLIPGGGSDFADSLRDGVVLYALAVLLPVICLLAVVSGIAGIKQSKNSCYIIGRDKSIAGLVLGAVTMAYFVFVYIVVTVY
jgi:hypothetical protein